MTSRHRRARHPHPRTRESPASAQLGQGRCPPGAVPTAVNGELWGDVTNGLGLGAVTPQIQFQWTTRLGDEG
jgi:hypothetical protein